MSVSPETPPFDWSGDELVFGVVAAGVAVRTAGSLVVDLLRPKCFGRSSGPCAAVLLSLVVAVAASLPVLAFWADPVYVAGHLDYTLLFMAGAAAWVGWVGRAALPWVGVSVRLDVVERSNPAAAVVTSAALLGTGVIYGLSNVGGGDPIWTTLVPAAAATALWLLLWLLLAAATGVADWVAIGRDPAAAARLAAYLLASAAILGAAAAGDFAGYGAAFRDLGELGWPAAASWLLAAAAERRHRPTPDRPVGRLAADAWRTVVAQVVLTVAALVWRVTRG